MYLQSRRIARLQSILHPYQLHIPLRSTTFASVECCPAGLLALARHCLVLRMLLVA